MLAECSPDQILALGEELIQRGNAAAVRAGVSRLYYANHLFAAVNVARKLRVELKGKGDDHSTLIRTLKRGKTMGVGNLLDKLRMYREHADYHINEAHLRNDCLFCMGKLKLDSLQAETIREEAVQCLALLRKV